MSVGGGLFAGAEILEVVDPGASLPARRAAGTAGRLAAQLGATVHRTGPDDPDAPAFYRAGKRTAADEVVADPVAWAAERPSRILLLAPGPGGDDPGPTEAINVVEVIGDAWHNEATLFAASGLADLFGDPDRAPLVPSGHWASVTVGYAVLGALASAKALAVRGGSDTITVDGVDALRWVNWKAPAMAWAGTPITREGSTSPWPAVECLDGHVAFVYTDRDWEAIVEMVDDDRLRHDRFANRRDRRAHQGDFLDVVRSWAADKSRSELDDLFHRHAVPGTAVLGPSELIDDVTLRHRRALTTERVGGVDVPSPVVPLRVRAEPGRPPSAEPGGTPVPLPLSGVRVLDLGVLTAGAGTSSLLADLGAEVIKVESRTKPDMFRFWTGGDDSPLFHFSNRSKLGVDIDLKDPAGRAAFLDLVATADAVIENYRRGVLERLELDFDTLRSVNPRIVLASVTGQGLTGPRAGHTTFGSTLEASSGLSALTAYDDGTPTISGANLNFPDQTVCLFAGAVITSAITASRSTGAGHHLDISQRDVAVYACGPVLDQLANGHDPTPWRLRRSAPGRWVAVGDDGTTNVEALDGAGVLAACRAGGSSAVVEAPDGSLVKGFPFTFAHRRLTISGPAPAIGADNDLVLTSSRQRS